jgi:uncharacterized BrkB/YihY/UPF0761 family membrane protein
MKIDRNDKVGIGFFLIGLLVFIIGVICLIIGLDIAGRIEEQPFPREMYLMNSLTFLILSLALLIFGLILVFWALMRLIRRRYY